MTRKTASPSFALGICICQYTFTCVYTCIHLYIDMCIHMHTYIHIYSCTWRRERLLHRHSHWLHLKIDIIIGLFCKRVLQKRLYSAKTASPSFALGKFIFWRAFICICEHLYIHILVRDDKTNPLHPHSHSVYLFVYNLFVYIHWYVYTYIYTSQSIRFLVPDDNNDHFILIRTRCSYWFVCKHTYMFLNIYIYAYIYISIYAYIYMHKWICIRVYIYIHIHTYTCEAANKERPHEVRRRRLVLRERSPRYVRHGLNM